VYLKSKIKYIDYGFCRRGYMDAIRSNELRANLKKYLDYAVEGQIVK